MQEFISRQTEVLLADKQQLLSALGSKDEAVRSLQGGLDHLTHQLDMALRDREVLMGQLAKVVSVGDLELLERRLTDAGGEGDEVSPGTGDGDQWVDGDYVVVEQNVVDGLPAVSTTDTISQ